MSDSNSSNRRKKKIVQEGLRQLKNKPGWDVEAFASRNIQDDLRDFDQQLRGNQVYQESGLCQDCVQVRNQSDDETALCDKHLAEAMGFGG